MENQHRLIKTYRELNQEEIDLMNEGKVLEAMCLEYIRKVQARAIMQKEQGNENLKGIPPGDITEPSIRNSINEADEALRSAATGKTQLQTAFMWIIRSTARPSEPAFEPAAPETSDACPEDECCGGNCHSDGE